MRTPLCILMLGVLAACTHLAAHADETLKPVLHLGFDDVQTRTVGDAAGGLTGLVQSNPKREPILGSGERYKGVYGRCARFSAADGGSIRVGGVPIHPAGGTLSFFYKPLMRKPTITDRYGILHATDAAGDVVLAVHLAASARYDHVNGLRLLGVHVQVAGPGFEVSAGSPIRAVEPLLAPGWHHVVIAWKAPAPTSRRAGYVSVHVDGKPVARFRHTKAPPTGAPRKTTVRIGQRVIDGVVAPRGCIDELMLFDTPLKPEAVRRLALRTQPATLPEPKQGVIGSVRHVVPSDSTPAGVPFGPDDVKPLAGAEVWVFKGTLAPLKKADRRHPALVKIVRSAADGSYRVPLAAGTYTVVARRRKGRFILHQTLLDAATGKSLWRPLRVAPKAWTKHIIVDVSKAVPVG